MSSGKKPRKSSKPIAKAKVGKKKAGKKALDKQPEVVVPDTTVKIARYLINTGVILVFFSLALFVLVFSPVIKEEVKYALRYTENSSEQDVEIQDPGGILAESRLAPVGEAFGIIVPKINANSSVIKDVDPYDSGAYQVALTKGVAHAKGTSLPPEMGNTFLFAHSSDNFYNANRYNSVFYLLNKMEMHDIFYISYEGAVFEYSITEKNLVNPEQVEYLTGNSTRQTATLMTCWPPGTTLQRLVIVGDLVSVSKR